MPTYEDVAEELGLSIVSPLGVNYDGDALQYINMRAPIAGANRFTYPEDGLLQRWMFDAGQGSLVDSITGDANFRLIANSNTAFVADDLTGGFAGLTLDKGGISISVADFTDETYHSGFYTPEDVSALEMFANTPGATVSIWLEADWTSLAAQGPAGIFSLVHEGVYDSGDAANGRWRPYEYSSGAGQTAVGLSFHHYQGMLYFMLVHGDNLTYRRLTTSLTGLSAGYHNIVGTFDGRFVRLYIDGELKDEADIGSYGHTVFFSDRSPRILVNFLHATTDYRAYQRSGMAAKYRDIACWDRGLLPTEILGVYNEAMYGPGVMEIMSVSEVAGYGDEYILPALLETFYLASTSRADVATVAREVLDVYSWVGSALNGVSTDQYHEPAYERVGIPALIEGIRTHLPIILSTFSGTDVAEGLRTVMGEIADSVDFDTSVFSLETLVAIELIRIEDNPDAAGSKFNRAISDGVSVRSIIIASWLILIQESASFEDSTSWKAEWFISLIERVTASSDVLTRMDAAAAVAVALSIVDTGEAGKGGTIEDSMDLSTEVISRATMFLDQIVKVSLAAESSGILTMFCPVSDQAKMTGDVDSAAILRDVIRDGIAFQILFGTGEATYAGWVLNTENFAVSRYENFPFNSFAKIGDSYYGANSNGLYSLDGDDDAGREIEAKATLGITNFNETRNKRFRRLHLGIKNNNPLLMKVIDDDGNEKIFKLKSTNDKIKRSPLDIGRGMNSVYWEFFIENIDGSDFELDEIIFIPIVLNRR